MEESKIEKYLKKKIELLNGKAYKFVSPGMSGVPDRIVLLPHGRIVFVELKAPCKKLRKLQEMRFKEIRKLGFRCEMFDSIESINEFVGEFNNEV